MSRNTAYLDCTPPLKAVISVNHPIKGAPKALAMGNTFKLNKGGCEFLVIFL